MNPGPEVVPMGSFSIVHWLIAAPTALPWLFAAVSLFGPFHGPAIVAAISAPHWLH